MATLSMRWPAALLLLLLEMVIVAAEERVATQLGTTCARWQSLSPDMVLDASLRFALGELCSGLAPLQPVLNQSAPSHHEVSAILDPWTDQLRARRTAPCPWRLEPWSTIRPSLDIPSGFDDAVRDDEFAVVWSKDWTADCLISAALLNTTARATLVQADLSAVVASIQATNMTSQIRTWAQRLSVLYIGASFTNASDLATFLNWTQPSSLGLRKQAAALDITALSVASQAIEQLDLSNNMLTDIPSNSFAHWPRLRRLSLSGNELTALPANVLTGSTALEVLKVESNQLTALPATFLTGLVHLRNLSLGINELTSLAPNFLSGLTNLQYLYLYFNQLTVLPPQFLRDQHQLVHLSLEDNLIANIPTGAFDSLTRLEYLYLYSNHISALQADAFARLTRLLHLSLESNRLTALPAGLLNSLPHLEMLYLYANDLTTLPAHFFDHQGSLFHLSMQYNALSELPAGIFDHLQALEALYLESNQLRALPRDAFQALTRLRILSLENNHLTTLLPGVFDAQTQLQQLNISYNDLTKLASDALVPCPQLRSLDLSNNRFAALQLNLRPLTMLEHLQGQRADCPANYQVNLETAPGLSFLSLDFGGANVQGISWQDHPRLVRLGLDLGADQTQARIDASGLTALRQLGVSCFRRARALAINPDARSLLQQLDVHGMTQLRSLVVTDPSLSLDSYNVSGNPLLTDATLLNASIFDMSDTGLDFAPLLCARAGSSFFVANHVHSTLDWARLLHHCLDAGTKVLDFSNNHISDIGSLAQALQVRLYVGNAEADQCRARDGANQPVCSFADLPILIMQDSPLQCGLQQDQSHVYDEHQAEIRPFGAHRFVCGCSPGYVQSGDRCVLAPTPIAQQPWFVVLITLCCVALLALLALGLRRWHVLGLRSLSTEHELERMLLTTSYADEIAELKEAWRVHRPELELVQRIDLESPGAFGEVWQARWQSLDVCVKVLNKRAITSSAAVQDFAKELDFLQRARHPQLVRFFGAGEGSFHGQDAVPFLVLELVQLGSLRVVLKRGGPDRQPLTTKQRLQILTDIATGLCYLHELGHAHRDVKSGNVLITDSLRAKVSDFGSVKLRERFAASSKTSTSWSTRASLRHSVPSISASIPESENLESSELALTQSTLVGTPAYMAPEVLATRRSGDFAADVFAYAVVMWETLTGRVPDLLAQEFSAEEPYEGPLMLGLGRLLQAGRRLDVQLIRQLRPDVPEDLIDLLEACWVTEVKLRPSLPSIVQRLARCSVAK